MEQVMEWCRFARYTIQQYLPLIKDLSEEERHQLISILIIPTLMNGWKLENLKEMSTGNLLTSTSALWSATSLCEDLNLEIKKHETSGQNYLKKKKGIEKLIILLKSITTKRNQEPSKKIV